MLAAVLTAISDQGPASLETLLDRLQLDLRPAEIARSFQGARADGLIEAEPGHPSDREPVYRLTRAGRAALGKEIVGDREPPVRTDPKVRIEAVLAVVDEFGEASVGLASWELCVTEEDVLPTWRTALEEGLLENTAYDAVHKEEMARLTARGRERMTVVQLPDCA